MNLLSQREIHVLIQILKHFTLNIILISQRRVKTVRRRYNAYNSWNLVALMEFNHFTQNKNFCFSPQLGISLICAIIIVQFSSVQFSRSVVSDSFWPHESQHTRPPCPSPTPGVYSNSCPSSWWRHPAIIITLLQIKRSKLGNIKQGNMNYGML